MGSVHTPKTCLYETLGVERSASDTELKKAYRKSALKWHPDKNVGNDEEAKIRFQEIQHAYSVLSDANERKWYDDHRDAILRGESGPQGGSKEGEGGGGGQVPDLFKYFNPGVYSGFGDDDGGFYAVFSRAFDEIYEKEEEEEGGGGGKHPPRFGGSTSPYAEVSAFYNYWLHFVSDLSFSWEDEYNYNEAPNRRVRRLMEAENNKARRAAKKKYQDEIRALVAFCRRRDVRVVKERLKVKAEREEKEKAQKGREKEKAAKMKQSKAEWQEQRAREMEREEEEALAGHVYRLADEDEEDEGKKRGCKARKDNNVVYRCALCKKDFKSDKAMANHENSKQHKKLLEKLDRQMLQEAQAEARAAEARAAREEEECSSSSSSDEEEDEDGEEDGGGDTASDDDLYVDPIIAEMELGLHLDEAEDEEEQEETEEEEESGDEEVDILKLAKSGSGQGNARRKQQQQVKEEGGGEGDSGEDSSSSSSEDEFDLSRLVSHGRRKEADQKALARDSESDEEDEEEEEDEDDDEEEEGEEGEEEGGGKGATAESEQGPKAAKADTLGVDAKSCADGKAEGGGGKPKKGRKEQNRRKSRANRAAGRTAAASGASGEGATLNRCRVCSQSFGSRSKLFAHLKETGHAKLTG